MIICLLSAVYALGVLHTLWAGVDCHIRWYKNLIVSIGWPVLVPMQHAGCLGDWLFE